MIPRTAAKKPLMWVLAIMALSGCAHHVDTRINSEGSATIASGTILRNGNNADAASEARRLVTDSLAGKGYRLADNGVYNLEVAWSTRPASLALGLDNGPEALARGKSDGCKATEYRLGVTLTNIADGRQVYRSTAAEYHCKTPETAVLPILVAAATADVGAPRGEYKIRRKL